MYKTPIDIILLRGIPGSGKSTFAKYIKKKNGIIFESDDHFTDKKGKYEWHENEEDLAYNRCIEKTKQAIKSGYKQIIISNTFITKDTMLPYKEIASDKDSKIKLTILVMNNDFTSVHDVPKSHVYDMKLRFEL